MPKWEHVITSTTTTFLFLTELLINAIIVETYLCNNYKKSIPKWNPLQTSDNLNKLQNPHSQSGLKSTLYVIGHDL